MDVQIGRDKSLFLSKITHLQICSEIKKYPYESGGIIGTNSKGIITSFEFDKPYVISKHEYYPNISFLKNIINDKWLESKTAFVGFVHSHLHNYKISQQDIKYAREILTVNSFLNDILIGIINLSDNVDLVKWYLINKESVAKIECDFV